MKIAKGGHKAVLSSLFYERTGQTSPTGLPVFQPKQFPFDKLMDAASAAKKLREGSETKENKVFYSDKEIEVTPSEASVLKELFDANKDKWDITVAETVKELNDLFDGTD